MRGVYFAQLCGAGGAQGPEVRWEGDGYLGTRGFGLRSHLRFVFSSLLLLPRWCSCLALLPGECPFWNQSRYVTPGEGPRESTQTNLLPPHSALDGVVPESRAYIALHAKILTSTSTTAPERLPANFHRPLDGVLDEASMADAVDLIMRCLEVEPGNRPSANDVLDHRFLLGNEGWSGLRGFTAWARATDGD